MRLDYCPGFFSSSSPCSSIQGRETFVIRLTHVNKWQNKNIAMNNVITVTNSFVFVSVCVAILRYPVCDFFVIAQ